MLFILCFGMQCVVLVDQALHELVCVSVSPSFFMLFLRQSVAQIEAFM